MPESLEIISAAFREIYEKHGGIQVVAEDEENTYIVPLGTLVMANNVEDLKEDRRGEGTGDLRADYNMR